MKIHEGPTVDETSKKEKKKKQNIRKENQTSGRLCMETIDQKRTVFGRTVFGQWYADEPGFDGRGNIRLPHAHLWTMNQMIEDGAFVLLVSR